MKQKRPKYVKICENWVTLMCMTLYVIPYASMSQLHDHSSPKLIQTKQKRFQTFFTSHGDFLANCYLRQYGFKGDNGEFPFKLKLGQNPVWSLVHVSRLFYCPRKRTEKMLRKFRFYIFKMQKVKIPFDWKCKKSFSISWLNIDFRWLITTLGVEVWSVKKRQTGQRWATSLLLQPLFKIPEIIPARLLL